MTSGKLPKQWYFWLTCMGLASGLPFGLFAGSLQAFLKSQNVDLATIGLLSYMSLPYTWKFIWAPLMDRFTFPIFGRRRFWMWVTQGLLVVIWMAFGFAYGKPIYLSVVLGILMAFVSASFDIVVDAYRREMLPETWLGVGNGVHVTSYLFAMRLMSGSLFLILSEYSWFVAFVFCGFLQALLWLCSWSLPVDSYTPLHTASSLWRSLVQSYWEPLKEFLTRSGAFWIFAFILLYKLGDNLAGQMLVPFYLDIGFSRAQVGAVSKIVSWVGLALGGLLGGFWVHRWGLYRSLWIFGMGQALSTLGFWFLLFKGAQVEALTIVVFFETFTAGMGNSAFVTFLSLLTHRFYTATQYAILSSLMGIPRVLLSWPAGILAQKFGWWAFLVSAPFWLFQVWP